MENSLSDQLLTFFRQRLQLRGDTGPLALDDSLFVSGRLDSLDALQTILFLEESCAVDFAGLDFSTDLIDTVESVVQLVQQRGS